MNVNANAIPMIDNETERQRIVEICQRYRLETNDPTKKNLLSALREINYPYVEEWKKIILYFLEKERLMLQL